MAGFNQRLMKHMSEYLDGKDRVKIADVEYQINKKSVYGYSRCQIIHIIKRCKFREIGHSGTYVRIDN